MKNQENIRKTQDIRFSTQYRYGQLYRFADYPNKPYDYKTHGIVCRMFPAFILNSKNPVLTQFMRFIDMQFINMNMFVEKLQKLKNYMKA